MIGFCSGGRHAFLVACQASGHSTPASTAGAATSSSTIPRRSTPSVRSRRSTSPRSSTCPLLGIFGNDDENPNKDQVNRTEAVLKKLGKNYEFHRYDGAGHAFFNTARSAYRAEQAADGWAKVFAFFHKHLG